MQSATSVRSARKRSADEVLPREVQVMDVAAGVIHDNNPARGDLLELEAFLQSDNHTGCCIARLCHFETIVGDICPYDSTLIDRLEHLEKIARGLREVILELEDELKLDDCTGTITERLFRVQIFTGVGINSTPATLSEQKDKLTDALFSLVYERETNVVRNPETIAAELAAVTATTEKIKERLSEFEDELQLADHTGTISTRLRLMEDRIGHEIPINSTIPGRVELLRAYMDGLEEVLFSMERSLLFIEDMPVLFAEGMPVLQQDNSTGIAMTRLLRVEAKVGAPLSLQTCVVTHQVKYLQDYILALEDGLRGAILGLEDVLELADRTGTVNQRLFRVQCCTVDVKNLPVTFSEQKNDLILILGHLRMPEPASAKEDLSKLETELDSTGHDAGRPIGLRLFLMEGRVGEDCPRKSTVSVRLQFLRNYMDRVKSILSGMEEHILKSEDLLVLRRDNITESALTRLDRLEAKVGDDVCPNETDIKTRVEYLGNFLLDLREVIIELESMYKFDLDDCTGPTVERLFRVQTFILDTDELPSTLSKQKDVLLPSTLSKQKDVLTNILLRNYLDRVKSILSGMDKHILKSEDLLVLRPDNFTGSALDLREVIHELEAMYKFDFDDHTGTTVERLFRVQTFVLDNDVLPSTLSKQKDELTDILCQMKNHLKKRREENAVRKPEPNAARLAL